jgi:glucose-6-phosphate isomerase
MKIQFDEINLRAAMIGDVHGLKSSEIKNEQGAALNALAGFRKLVEEGRYGFPHLPFQTAVIEEIERYAAKVRGSFDTVCLVGIGGSALGAWALDCGLRGPHPVQRAFGPEHPRLVILDNADPALTMAALGSMNPKKTLAVVIAKSGATAETVGVFLMVREWLGPKASKRIAAVTSEDLGDLKALATREGYPAFHIPKNVGGRFSVLSAAGLLPAALIGVDIRKLCKGAAGMTHLAWQPDLARNLALRSALLHYLIWTLLVPAALGRIARQDQDAQGRNRVRRPDAGGRTGRHGPAFAGAALHGRAQRQGPHVLDHRQARRSRPHSAHPAGPGRFRLPGRPEPGETA